MAQMNVYLSNHHGTTREAFDFYEKLFGAQRDGLIRYRDMADALKSAGMYKEEWGEKIAHTAIKFNNMTLMGSDVMHEEAPEGAPASFLVYSADSVPDADRVLQRCQRAEPYFTRLRSRCGKHTTDVASTSSAPLGKSCTRKWRRSEK